MKNHLLVSLHSWGRGEVKRRGIERSAGQKIEKGRAQKFKRQKRLAISICTNHKVPYTTDFLLTTAQMSKRPLLVRLDFNGPDEQLIEQITLPYLSYSQIILRSNILRHHFYLPKVQVQNGNGVLNRLVPCLRCMKIACWLLQVILDLYYYIR